MKLCVGVITSLAEPFTKGRTLIASFKTTDHFEVRSPGGASPENSGEQLLRLMISSRVPSDSHPTSKSLYDFRQPSPSKLNAIANSVRPFSPSFDRFETSDSPRRFPGFTLYIEENSLIALAKVLLASPRLPMFRDETSEAVTFETIKISSNFILLTVLYRPYPFSVIPFNYSSHTSQ